MTKLRPLVLVVLNVFLIAVAAGAAGAGERQTVPLLTDWKFHQGVIAGATASEFDDRNWEAVTVPHTWNGQDGQDGGGNFYRGDGWYRKRFTVDASWKTRRVFVQFDGANRTAEVFVNGRRLGVHRGGFARFRFDATPALKFGAENVLSVRVNNDPNDNMIPVSGDFTFFGGIYRAVSLVATDPVHVDLLDYASPGVYADQSAVSEHSADVAVRVKLANDSDAAVEANVRVVLLDAAGQLVRSAESTTSIPPNLRVTAKHRIIVDQPHLWNGLADPYLYQVRTEVRVGGAVRDVVTIPLGLRSFAVDAAKGFSLNGKPLDLRGPNRHQDRLNKGWAISDDEEREDFAIIREMGSTAIRQSHYQHSQFFNDLGDREGIIMWAELAYVNDVKDNPEFFENAKEQLRELIRQNHHHASILFWSIGNETFIRDKNVIPADANDRLLRALAAVAREEDGSRLSTYASNGDVKEPRAAIVDVIGFNHYFGWYRGTLDYFATWLDEQRAMRPDLRIGMSEYGAGANITHHEEPAQKPDAPGQWHPEEWQALYHEAYWKAMAARPWVWCKFIWVMFDFASDGRNEGATPGVNDKGVVSADRKTRKDAFYWYKANWSEEPVLHITSRRFTPRTAAATTVKVYSNADSVELWVNGRSAGVVESRDRIFQWPGVTLLPGENKIEARATRAGAAVRDECAWSYTPTAVP